MYQISRSSLAHKLYPLFCKLPCTLCTQARISLASTSHHMNYRMGFGSCATDALLMPHSCHVVHAAPLPDRHALWLSKCSCKCCHSSSGYAERSQDVKVSMTSFCVSNLLALAIRCPSNQRLFAESPDFARLLQALPPTCGAVDAVQELMEITCDHACCVHQHGRGLSESARCSYGHDWSMADRLCFELGMSHSNVGCSALIAVVSMTLAHSCALDLICHYFQRCRHAAVAAGALVHHSFMKACA